MPRTKSAKKALRVAKRRQSRNYRIRISLKTALKKFTKKKEKNTKDLAAVFSIIDKATKIKIIHKNKAARLKARLAKFAVKTIVAKGKTKIKKHAA